MKRDSTELDALIVELVANLPRQVETILADSKVRAVAARVCRRRAGTSPAQSVDATVLERLQALRRSGQIAYDHATSRWFCEKCA